MRVVRLFAALTLYYLAVTAITIGMTIVVPESSAYLPIGGAEALLTGPSDDPFEAIEIGANRAGDLTGSIVWLLMAMFGALYTVLPVSWLYMSCRNRAEYNQSIVETIIVLPIVVTAIVVIVHNSLALAFSLAGIVAGVRFRNTLKSSGDALYIFLAIAIGLSAGIGALEVALVTSIFFNYLFVILWSSDYGAIKGAHRFFRPHNDEPEVEPVPSAKDK